MLSIQIRPCHPSVYEYRTLCGVITPLQCGCTLNERTYGTAHDHRKFLRWNVLRYFFSASLSLSLCILRSRIAITHRYDARLLLDALPTMTPDSPTTASGPPHSRPDSAAGWSDLPSDSEDTFFLTPTETADLHRTKRLRHLDALRTARLRALSPDPDPDAQRETDPWGSSDEEPDATQMELMSRTAAHIARAANDAQLRARILAHHGADPRFAFLRGRWDRAWVRAQADARRDVLAEREVQSAGALGGLTGYGSESEDDGGEEVADRGTSGGDAAEHVIVPMGAVPGVRDEAVQDEAEPEELTVRAVQEVRRAKAREWAEKRRAAKALAMTHSDNDNQRSSLDPN
jgi:hypothetical protein